MTELDNILNRISATKDTIYGLELAIEHMDVEYRTAKLYERQLKRVKDETDAKRTLFQKIGFLLRYK